jgi:DedD protein
MDRRVKERLVGASILVILIVLIVPELLSGPPAPAPLRASPGLPASAPEPVRNITVDLATSKAPEPEPVDAAASSAQPPQTQGMPATATPLETAQPPPTSPTSAAKAAPAGRAWAVQLGVFASRGNADKLVRQLKGQGFSAYLLPGGSGSSLRYRVRVGPMADHGAAYQLALKLKSLGYVGSLVPPAA